MPTDENGSESKNENDEDIGPCDYCSKVAYLSKFSGWNDYGPDEYAMLCDECHETATIED